MNVQALDGPQPFLKGNGFLFLSAFTFFGPIRVLNSFAVRAQSSVDKKCFGDWDGCGLIRIFAELNCSGDNVR